MKGILVVNNKLICLREKEIISTRIEGVPMVLSPDRNVLNRKLNRKPESRQTLGKIKRRRLVAIVGRRDMLRRHVRRRVLTRKRRLKYLKGML